MFDAPAADCIETSLDSVLMTVFWLVSDLESGSLFGDKCGRIGILIDFDDDQLNCQCIQKSEFKV